MITYLSCFYTEDGGIIKKRGPVVLPRRVIPHTTWSTVITPSTSANTTTRPSRDVITHSRDVTLTRSEPRVLERCQVLETRWDRTMRFARSPKEKPVHDMHPEMSNVFYIVTTCYLLRTVQLFVCVLNQMNVVCWIYSTTYKLHILLNNIMKQLKYRFSKLKLT